MHWLQGFLALGLTLGAAAQTSGDNARCVGAGGQCQFWDQPCDGGTYIIGYCGLPSYWRCCLKYPNNDNQCNDAGGSCRNIGDGCSNGRFRKGLCSGGENRKCCTPYPTNDDGCTAAGGKCQNLNTHCASTFRKDLCSGSADRCCGATGGCDPSVDLDFQNLEPAADFDEDEMLGTWYSVRWYLPSRMNITEEIWDLSNTVFRKNGQPNSVFVKANGRVKNERQCFNEIEFSIERQRSGVYTSTFQGRNYLTTNVYQTKLFMIQIYCINPTESGCSDHGAMFWSRYQHTRDQDIRRGENILRSLCYPYMVRYLNPPQNMDCVPPPKSCGKSKGGNGMHDGMMPDKGCKKMEKKERVCDPIKNNYRVLWADNDFSVKKLKGLWYMARWYRPLNDYLGRERLDRSIYYETKDEHDNVVFFDDNWRNRGTEFCADGVSSNQTKVKHGVYEWEYGEYAEQDLPAGSKGLSTYVHIAKNFHVEVVCFYNDANTDNCDDVAAGFWSREKKADPADIMKGVKILDNLCYHDPKLFTITTQEIDCGKQSYKDCSEEKKRCGKGHDDDGNDDGNYMRGKGKEKGKDKGKGGKDFWMGGKGCGGDDDDDDDDDWVRGDDDDEDWMGAKGEDKADCMEHRGRRDGDGDRDRHDDRRGYYADE